MNQRKVHPPRPGLGFSHGAMELDEEATRIQQIRHGVVGNRGHKLGEEDARLITPVLSAPLSWCHHGLSGWGPHKVLWVRDLAVLSRAGSGMDRSAALFRVVGRGVGLF